VIALLLEGVSTPYELQSLAGLSAGATIPILQSLVEDGHVRAGKPGTRGRVAYVVTSKGKKWLEAGRIAPEVQAWLDDVIVPLLERSMIQ
jgi:predicted transcriptional regulator